MELLITVRNAGASLYGSEKEACNRGQKWEAPIYLIDCSPNAYRHRRKLLVPLVSDIRNTKEKEGCFKMKNISSDGDTLVLSVLLKESLTSLGKKPDQERRVNVSLFHTKIVQMIFGPKLVVRCKRKYDHENLGLCLTISLSSEDRVNIKVEMKTLFPPPLAKWICS